MRRHAKASSAGSTSGQGASRGSFLRGVLATRGAFSDANGSSGLAARRLALPLFAVFAALAVMVTPASASKTHLLKETFGAAAQPSFTNAAGIAVDQAGGEVLVIDAGASTISRYNPDGTPANFSALGSNVIDGTGTGDETPQNGLAFASASESQIAVDNSGGATDGDIYVTQDSPNLINIFSEDGEYLGQLTAAGATPFAEACGVAVDPAGNVYVGDYSNGIHKFVPAANPPVDADNTATFTSVSSPCTLASGAGSSAGALFAAQYNGPVSKLDAATGALGYVVAGGSNTTLSVDPGTGHVYVATANKVDEYDAAGASSASLLSSVSLDSPVRGVAVSESNGNIYVSRNGAANLSVYGPLVTLPDVVTGSASSIGETGATLNATVNPEGIELDECSFEYGPTVSYGQSAPCAESTASIGTGISPVAVHADLSGLTLGGAYHFRLVASNENGTVNGTDETFKTLSTPVIAAQWPASVVLSEATLKAEINPEGFSTTYHLEYGTDTSYGSETAELNVGSDKAEHTVSSFLEGLAPGTTYHYRFVATNSIGSTEGDDRTFVTYASFIPETSCPNQAFRTGPAAALPDCRAYEMVSPVDKNGGDIYALAALGGGLFSSGLNQASVEGTKITYSSYKSFGGQASSHYSNQYIASRGPGGWTTEGVNLPQGTTVCDPQYCGGEINLEYQAFLPDLSSGWAKDYSAVPAAENGIVGYLNLERRYNPSGKFESNTPNVPSIAPEPEYESGNPKILGYSSDASHVIFVAEAAMTPDAAANTNPQVYDYSEGDLHLVSVLPSGVADPEQDGVGAYRGANFYTATVDHAVSDDGSRVFWTSGGGVSGYGTLYVRVDGTTTLPVSGVVPGGERAIFERATPDGSKALFSVEAGQSSFDLYESDVDTETPTLIAHKLVGAVLGASDDLSDIYFVTKEDLGGGATPGERNFYLDHNGTMTFIATLSATDTSEQTDTFGSSSFNPQPLLHSGRVTPDGRHAAFMSNRSLTGYDNADANNGEPDSEVFVYDADADELTCASCNPSGARPVGQGLQEPFAVKPDGTGSEYTNNNGPKRIWTAAWLTTYEHEMHAARILSDDGSRLFFNSYDPLLPQDTNSKQDVYEWEAQGSGSCKVAGGCLSLISTGESSNYSEFVDASPDGNDVFFRTESSLVPQDPGLLDIYDARSSGGFPVPAAPAPCEGQACQSPPAAPNDPTPASVAFNGPGNAKVKAKKKKHHGRKKHPHKKKHRAHPTKKKG